MKDIRFPKPPLLPKVLSIDEFRGNAGGQKFQVILTDAHNHDLVDILPSRTQASLIDYFKSFPNRKDVRYFIMDMNRSYLELAKTFLPKATIVIDRFHVIRYVTWALENVRKRIQKQLHPDKRKYFKRSRRLLLSHQKKLKEDHLQALEVMLSQSHELAMAYYLNSFDYSYSNGYTEGSNNKMKVIKRNAYGYRNFDNFRNRIFLSMKK